MFGEIKIRRQSSEKVTTGKKFGRSSKNWIFIMFLVFVFLLMQTSCSGGGGDGGTGSFSKKTTAGSSGKGKGKDRIDPIPAVNMKCGTQPCVE